MLADDVIQKCTSAWAFPVMTIVARAYGQPRFCVDYRRSTLNRLLLRETWPMTNMESNLARFISVADIQSACWQIPVRPDHIERTALLVTNSGKYCLKKDAVWSLQKAVERLEWPRPYSRVKFRS